METTNIIRVENFSNEWIDDYSIRLNNKYIGSITRGPNGFKVNIGKKSFVRRFQMYRDAKKWVNANNESILKVWNDLQSVKE